MTEKKSAIPSAKDKERALEMLKKSNQELELTTVALDKLIEMIETELNQRQHQRNSIRTISSRSAT